MKVIVVGTGPAGLMAGYQLLKLGVKVHFYDQKKAAGRKFLVAGHGGFNLTHSKSINEFVENYSHPKIQDAVRFFDNQKTIEWLQEIGIPTFVGSSGKIFPQKGIKPIEVLDAWLKKIEQLGGMFHFEHRLGEWKKGKATFHSKDGELNVFYDRIIFCLGGASWKKTGSDGTWIDSFSKNGIKVNDFLPSNAGMNCKEIPKELEGLILKNCTITLGDNIKMGEVLFTKYGLEGAPIYALNGAFRNGNNVLSIDLKPSILEQRILEVLYDKQLNRTQQLNVLKIPKKIIGLLKLRLSREEYLNNEIMVKELRSMNFRIDSLRPIDEAISTVGGIDMDEVNENFELKKQPHHFVIGEMLDWDAPTGGYLLQACFSMGAKVAEKVGSQV